MPQIQDYRFSPHQRNGPTQGLGNNAFVSLGDKEKCIALTIKKISFSISISLLDFSPCLSVSVAVIKHFDQKQLEEERLYLAHPPFQVTLHH